MSKETRRTRKFVFTFIVIVICNQVVGQKTETTQETREQFTVCRTKECRDFAASLQKTLQFNVSPCDDLLTFVCGGINSKSEIAPNRVENGVIGSIREKVGLDHIDLLQEPKIKKPRNALENVRAYFQACVEAEHISAEEIRHGVIELLQALGGLPLIPSSNYDPKLDYIDRISRAFKTFGADRLIGCGVGLDLMNASSRLITFSQADNFGIPRPILIGKDKASRQIIQTYQEYMKNTFCLLLDCPSTDAIHEEVSQIIQFEISLAKISLPPEKKHDYSTRFKKMTLQELDRKFPKIPWLRFLNNVFHDVGIIFDGNTIVGFMDPDYYSKLPGVLESVDPRTIVNYLGWRAYQTVPVFNTDTLKNFTLQMNNALSGIKVSPKRTRTCAETVNEDFPLSLGKIYVKKFFTSAIKEEVEEFMKYLRVAVKGMLINNDWMDTETKREALKKLESISEHIGYPKWLEFNLTRLEEEEGLPAPFDNTAYIQSVIKLKEHRTRYALQQYKKPVDRNQWTTSPATVNAFYNSIKNAITFPAGIIQKPLYRFNTMKAINYGAIGSIVGHEITHAFDNIGNQFDENGNLRNWWTNATKEKFNIRKKCYIEQYGNVTDKQTGMRLNGELTVSENIADNGGLRGAYEAYLMTNTPDERLPGLEGINDKQMFFIANAMAWCGTYRNEALRNRILTDLHTPIQYRAYMSARNLRQFSDAFKCPIGSPMNPHHKCELW